MSEYEAPPPTVISPESPVQLADLQAEPLAILCGRNNSGKTYILRELAKAYGQGVSYLGPARFSNFTAMSAYGPVPNRLAKKYQQIQQMLRQQGRNIDNSPFNLQQAIAEMSDDRRERLFQLVSELLRADARISLTIPDNEMSQRYVSVDGFNLSYSSSGFRLVTTLLASFLDVDYQAFLVDEPELGLSPEVQGAFADFLLQEDSRRKFFPHMEQIVLATHSPIFLDRVNLANNFVIDRVGAEITIRRVESLQDLTALQFLLLGNRFETLFLPSAILLVEGPTDHAYLSRVLAVRFPSSLLSIIPCQGDGRIRQVLNIAKQMLTDLRRSPYADRFFVVLDSTHGQGLREHLAGEGVPETNVVVWSKNGIEHLYPEAILTARFGAFEELDIREDEVGANGIWVKKRELSEYVVARTQADTELPAELQERILGPLAGLLY